MEIKFETIAEDQSGPSWKARFDRLWPHFKKWYIAEGHEARPTYLECERAIKTYLPKLRPTWEGLVGLAGNGDLQARFLSLYCPPPYLTGCSQAARTVRAPLLVRNYDYSPRLHEGLIWRTKWNGKTVIGSSDCLIGLLDGMNEDGLAVSLNFGGMKQVGTGFGAPLIVRYLLEFCSDVHEASRVLRTIPLHMAYNIMLLDKKGDFMTAFTRPDSPTILHRFPASTNHQDRIAWPRHAEATATLQRERRLFELLGIRDLKDEQFIHAFLEQPLHQTSYDRGYGTLYTAAYRPASGEAEFHWPRFRLPLSLTHFPEQTFSITLAP